MIKTFFFRFIIIVSIAFPLTVNAVESINAFSEQYIINKLKKRIVTDFKFVSPEHITVDVKNKQLFKSYPAHSSFFSVELPTDSIMLGKRLFSIVFYDQSLTILDEKKIATDSSAQALAYYTTRKIDSRSALTKDDFKQKLIDVTSFTSPFTLTVDDILNQQASKTISEGAILSSKWLEPVPLIQVGDYITAIIATKEFQIEVPAQALDPGMIGEFIRIKTNVSSKIIKGEISHEKSVIINSI